jgi:hypothetical protein
VISSSTLEGYLKAEGLDTSVFLCIAQHESNLNANAMNTNGGKLVSGLFQEDDDNGFTSKQLCDPSTSCKAASALLKKCGICPWIDDPW